MWVVQQVRTTTFNSPTSAENPIPTDLCNPNKSSYLNNDEHFLVVAYMASTL